MESAIELIKGGNHQDNRGRISFVNDFSMQAIKRFYVIQHKDLQTVRAWLAHKKEHKWFYVVSGSYKIVVVKPDNWETPDSSLSASVFTLTENESNILHVPGGHAFGFKALEENSKLIVYSNFTTEESMNDDYRFDQNLWYKW